MSKIDSEMRETDKPTYYFIGGLVLILASLFLGIFTRSWYLFLIPFLLSVVSFVFFGTAGSVDKD